MALHIFMAALAAPSDDKEAARLARQIAHRLYLAFPNTLGGGGGGGGDGGGAAAATTAAEEAAAGTSALDPVVHRALHAACAVRVDGTVAFARALEEDGGGGGEPQAAAALAAAAGVGVACVRSAATSFVTSAALLHPRVVLRHLPMVAALLYSAQMPLHQGTTAVARKEATSSVEAAVKLLAALAASHGVPCDAAGMPSDGRARQLLLALCRVVGAGGPHSRSQLQGVAGKMADMLQRWQLRDPSPAAAHNVDMLDALDALVLAFPTLRTLAAVRNRAAAAGGGGAF